MFGIYTVVFKNYYAEILKKEQTFLNSTKLI